MPLLVERFLIGDVCTLLGSGIPFFGQVVFHDAVAGGAILLNVRGFGAAWLNAFVLIIHAAGRTRLAIRARPSWVALGCMNDRTQRSGKERNSPPVALYAAILGGLVIIAVVYAVIAGQWQQNKRATGTLTSPAPSTSLGPSPRY